jgi:hypothetical protein
MHSPTRSRNWLTPALLLLGCVVACAALSSQSIWIDEAQTVEKAAQPTLAAWWNALYMERNSNLQLPLYMIYIWGWARGFGTSELAMRAANVPFFFLGLFATWHFLRRRPGLRNAALLIYCVHPFVWYYLDEARPYMMQLSGAMLAAGALFEALDEPEEPPAPAWWWLFCTGITLLCATGLLGVPWAIAIGVLLFGCPGFRKSIFGSGRGALVLFLPLLAGLAIYFAWTLKLGARPGETGMKVASIPFVFYEQLGFTGLGPGRADMRSLGVGPFLHYLPWLLLLGLPLLYAMAVAARTRFGLPPGRFAAICLGVIIPTVLIFGLGFAKGFLVVGRHLTPLLPFILAAMAGAVLILWNRGRLLDRAAVVLIVGALAVSSLECRFAFRHQKDDNKGAVEVAKAALARGEIVWWLADGISANYYGLQYSRVDQPGTVLLLWKPTPDRLASEKAPDLIILSKPDLFDINGATRNYIQSQGYVEAEVLPAFTIWKKL